VDVGPQKDSLHLSRGSDIDATRKVLGRTVAQRTSIGVGNTLIDV